MQAGSDNMPVSGRSGRRKEVFSMDKRVIREFFDRCAPSWDAEMVKSDEIIGTILDNAGAGAGSRVLDVACGTGVLIPYYLERGVASVLGVDISPEMIRFASAKFDDPRVSFICADVEELKTAGQDVPDAGFDCIVVYNAFPHFPQPDRLICCLSGMLAPGGTLTVAHGMSREKIDRHHHGCASMVSRGLMHDDELAAIFERCGLAVTVKISDERMYQVAGRKPTAE